jgi:hypothetical protein
METIRYTQLGKEDINFGIGTFEARLADGRVVTLSRVDVGAIVNDTALSTPVTNFSTTGTWTPSVGGNATYTAQVGHYTKIGNVVNLSCTLTINVLGTGSTNTVSGLPYAVKSGCNFTATVYFGDLASTVVTVIAYAGSGDTEFVMRAIQAAGVSILSSVNIFGDDAEIRFSGSYLTD